MNAKKEHKISAGRPEKPAPRLARTVRQFFGELSRNVQLMLVATRAGRIALHLLVALQSGHWLWHRQGIARELSQI